MKRFISIFSAVIFTFCIFLNLNPLPTYAATTLPIQLSYVSQVIPDSTTLLSSGVVKDAKPTYRVTVRATVASSVNFSGATLTFNNPNTTTVVRQGAATFTLTPSWNGPGTSYTATVSTTYDVRGTVTSFSCTATIGGTNFTGSKTSTIYFNVASNYSSTFRITYYVIAKEDQYTGSYNTTAPGISSKQFKYAFLQDVKVQGSGYSHYGEYMQYNSSTGNFYIVTYPKTATGTSPTTERTIAVDPYYIPRLTAYKAKVNITSVGDRQAEDGGGAITGRRIDVFYGTGKPSTVPPWSATYKNVYYYGNNLW